VDIIRERVVGWRSLSPILSFRAIQCTYVPFSQLRSHLLPNRSG